MIKLINGLLYNPALPFSDQTEKVQEYISEIAFSQQNAILTLSEFQGDNSPGQPRRFTKLVHQITGDTASIQTTVNWFYPNEYGSFNAFDGIHTLNVEVI